MKNSLLKKKTSAFATLASSGVSKLEKMKIRNVKGKKKILSSHCWSMVKKTVNLGVLKEIYLKLKS